VYYIGKGIFYEGRKKFTLPSAIPHHALEGVCAEAYLKEDGKNRNIQEEFCFERKHLKEKRIVNK